MPAPRISFILLTYRRPALLRRCLESLRISIRDESAEVLVGFNGEDLSNPGLAAEVSRRYGWVRTFELPRLSRGAARNRLIRKASGDILFFLDDDTEVPPSFTAEILAKFDGSPEIAAAGGPNLGLREANAFEKAVDFLLSSAWGAGPARIRHRSGKGIKDQVMPGWCFTLSNLGVRREVFERDGLFFDEKCASAEENLLLHHVERGGGTILYSPDLYVYHQRRGDLFAFWRQVFLSGWGRGQITRTAPGSLQIFTLAPLAWVAYLISLSWRAILPYSLVPLCLYLVWCAAECVNSILKTRDMRVILWFPALGASGHLIYAAGFLRGLLAGPSPAVMAQIRGNERKEAVLVSLANE